MQIFSIFNDILGPVLTGPSSSHTAGPCRIGYMAGHLVEGKVKKVRFEFHKGGSFAASYNTQGTDRGLVGGMLGMLPDDDRLPEVFEYVGELEYEFAVTEYNGPHPNTVKITEVSETGERATATGISTGGGIMEILEVNGFKVSMNGKAYELLIFSDDEIPVDIMPDAEAVNLLSNEGGYLLEVKSLRNITEDEIQKIKDKLGFVKVRLIPPVYKVLPSEKYEIPFTVAAEMESFAQSEGISAGQAGLRYEMAAGNITEDDAMEMMYDLVDVMEESISKGLASKRPGRLIKAVSGDYLKASEEGKLLDLGAMNPAIAYTMSMVERNSYYAKVVAAPTSGACGTVGGSIMGVADYIGADKKERAMALFAAGAAGLAIAKQATFAAEVCGCQAECGAASAMAAAGIIELMHGSAVKANEASSISLQNVLGMICDSVANLVEVPCLGRNVLGTVNAISAANMVMAGEEGVIPFDETICSMLDVGNMMPPELCCTNSGGLAICKTSLELAKRLNP